MIKTKVKCYNCNKFGHFANECHRKNGQNKHAGEANMARDEDSDSDPVVLMVTINIEPGASETWYLDSGCSNHMTSHREWLVDIDSSKRSKVRFADNRTVPVEGMGNVLIKKKDGKSAITSDVLYVPEMKSKLLSIGQLLSKGFNMHLENGCLEVFDSDDTRILNVPLAHNRTFQVKIQPVYPTCLSAEVCEEDVWLWHCRYGHLNFTSLCLLRSKEMVTGLPPLKIPDKV